MKTLILILASLTTITLAACVSSCGTTAARPPDAIDQACAAAITQALAK